MKRIIFEGLIALLATGAYADYKANKKVDGGELQKELIAGGCQVDSIGGDTTSATVYGPACPAAAAIIAAHDPMVRIDKIASDETRAKVLGAKARLGTLTDESEQQELFGLLAAEAFGK